MASGNSVQEDRYIYVIEKVGGVKPGRSKSPPDRKRRLEFSGGFVTTGFFSYPCTFAFKLEQEILKRYAKHRRKGEWLENVPFLAVVRAVCMGIEHGIKAIRKRSFDPYETTLSSSWLSQIEWSFYSKHCKFDVGSAFIELWTGTDWYPVDLESCQNPAHVVDWIMQVKNKEWCSPQLLMDFVHCLDFAWKGYQGSDYQSYLHAHGLFKALTLHTPSFSPPPPSHRISEPVIPPTPPLDFDYNKLLHPPDSIACTICNATLQQNPELAGNFIVGTQQEDQSSALYLDMLYCCNPDCFIKLKDLLSQQQLSIGRWLTLKDLENPVKYLMHFNWFLNELFVEESMRVEAYDHFRYLLGVYFPKVARFMTQEEVKAANRYLGL